MMREFVLLWITNKQGAINKSGGKVFENGKENVYRVFLGK